MGIQCTVFRARSGTRVVASKEPVERTGIPRSRGPAFRVPSRDCRRRVPVRDGGRSFRRFMRRPIPIGPRMSGSRDAGTRPRKHLRASAPPFCQHPKKLVRGVELFGARAEPNVDDSPRRNRTNESRGCQTWVWTGVRNDRMSIVPLMDRIARRSAIVSAAVVSGPRRDRHSTSPVAFLCRRRRP